MCWHTGRFQGYTFRDLTDDIPGICAHWEREGLDFSAVYTGYLASARQIALVRDVIRSRLRPGGVLIVDSRVTGGDPHGETDALHGMANWIFYEKAAS